jgi:hypothetical protein
MFVMNASLFSRGMLKESFYRPLNGTKESHKNVVAPLAKRATENIHQSQSEK